MMNKREYIAGGVTAAVAALIVVVLLCVYLSFPPKDWTPPEKARIELEPIELDEEFIAVEDVLLHDANSDETHLSPAGAPDAENEAAPGSSGGNDRQDAGQQGPPAAVTTTDRPSPVQEKPQPQPTNPGAAKPTEESAKPESKWASVKDNMTFTDQNQNSSGHTPDASSGQGKGHGGPDSSGFEWVSGHRWLPGAIKQSQPRGKEGTVIVEFTVNAQGLVTSAKCVGGKGAASADETICRQCEELVKSYTFKRNSGDAAAPGLSTGRKVFHIRP